MGKEMEQEKNIMKMEIYYMMENIKMENVMEWEKNIILKKIN